MSYSIDEFWIPRLQGVLEAKAVQPLAGWSFQLQENPSFVEAELRLRDGYGDPEAPVWLVAAPGVVGKSTLAKEICARSGAAYLDLAHAETVAGNYLTGGLAKVGLYDLWQKNQTTVLIDALDEARLRVTQSSFADFLADVEERARNREVPTVLFGRVGIMDEAWLMLSEKGLSCPIFEIDFFDPPRAHRFVMSTLGRLAAGPRYTGLAERLERHKRVYQDITTEVVSRLGEASGEDPHFAGYAPVLEAVAKVLADVTNPGSLSDMLRQKMQEKVTQQLTQTILEREAEKLRDALGVKMPDHLKQALYTPEEQLDKLAAEVLRTPVPALGVLLTTEQREAYESAVENFLLQHPFLDGTSRQASGAVFAAVITAHALLSGAQVRTAAEDEARRGPHAPNPFLIDFYLTRARRLSGDGSVIVPEHVVFLYESVRARIAASETARMTVEGEQGSEELDVEIQVGDSRGVAAASHGSYRRFLFKSSQAGALLFGRQMSGVAVDAPQMDLVIGSGNPVEIIAPVLINVGRIRFDCPEIVVQPSDHEARSEESVVVLEAGELQASQVNRVPIVRRGADLLVSWPGAVTHPWTNFASDFVVADGTDPDDALRALRRLVLAFRSHGKGRLARYEDKIEHIRITKGELGVALRDRLMVDRVITKEGHWYFLDPDALGRVTGATYQDLNLKRYGSTVKDYASSVQVGTGG